MENNSPVEAYFAAIEAELEDVPAARRTEFVDEVRAHLHAMIEAKRADGRSESQAWQSAMSEFGEPQKVGRDLRRQWADSAQLESEGVPLSLRRKLWIFALPVVASIVIYAMATLIISPRNNAGWQMPVIAAIALGSLAYGVSSTVRYRGGWTPSTIVGCAGAFVVLSNVLININGYRSWGGEWREWGITAFILLYVSVYGWLYKRERTNRPWQFSALYKTSPIAAEQTYRLGPLVGLAMGTTMGCIGIISVGLQFFGLPIALLLCAVSIGSAVVYGKWRFR